MTVYTTPRTWVDGEVPTKAIMDTHLRDNMLHLKEGVDPFALGNDLLGAQHSVAGVPNSGTALTTLLSVTVPADTLFEDRTGLYVVAAGSLAANANPKLVRLMWGPIGGPSVAQPIDTGLNIAQGGNFRIKGWIHRYGLKKQYCHAYLTIGDAAPAANIQGVDRAFGTEDETADILVHLVGQSTAGSSQVFGHSLLVYLLKAPAA